MPRPDDPNWVAHRSKVLRRVRHLLHPRKGPLMSEQQVTAEPTERIPSSVGWQAADPVLCWNRTGADGKLETYNARTDGQIDYEVLRDTLIAAFNPPDDDIAEPALMTDTIDRVWAFVVRQPCVCTPDEIEDGYPGYCERCQVLGRIGDKGLDR